MKQSEIKLRQYRSIAIGQLVPQYQHLFVDLLKKEKDNVKKVYKINKIISENMV